MRLVTTAGYDAIVALFDPRGLLRVGDRESNGSDEDSAASESSSMSSIEFCGRSAAATSDLLAMLLPLLAARCPGRN